MLLGDAGRPADPKRAAALYQAASDDGDALATLRSAVLAAEGVGRALDWGGALDLLGHAAELGDERAQAQLRLFAGERAEAGVRWRALRGLIDIEALLTPPPLERLSQVSMVGVVRNFAPLGFPAWLMHQAKDRLTPTYVQVAATGERQLSQARTATSFSFLLLMRDLVVSIMQERAARLTGIPVDHHEAPTVISYGPGQQYEAHYDFVPPRLLESMPEFRLIGQRTMTSVTYLNEDFVGAATLFPRLNLEFRGGPGDAVVFSNVLPDGSPDRNTLHAGTPPERGRKWVLSQWLRSKPVPPS